MKGEHADAARLQHALDAIYEVEKYTSRIAFEEFEQNSMMRFACIKQLEIIGEACNHLSKALKARFTEIQWAQIVGMRNVFVHEYFGIDTRLVWEIIQHDMPELRAQLLRLRAWVQKST